MTKQLTAQDISDRFHGKPSGEGFITKCPAHPDTNPSLSIGTGDDGRVLLKCHAGCEFKAILKAMDLTVADITPPKERHTKARKRIITAYDYRNADGTVIYQTVRYDPKSFSQRRSDGKGGWIPNMQGVEPLPYHLPEVLKAVEHGKTVVIVEGEKDADNLAKRGFTTTTNHGGALKWSEKHSQYLKGADVIVVPDNDKPKRPGEKPVGEHHAEQVIASLRRCGARRVRLVRIPLPHKDVSDWLSGGGTEEAFNQLIAQAIDCTATSGDDETGAGTASSQLEATGEDESDTAVSNPDISDLTHQFARKTGDEWAYDEPAATWRRWAGTYWETSSDTATTLVKTVVAVIKDMGARVTSRSRINDVLYVARAECRRDFTPHGNLINFRNCTIDWETGELRAHDQADNLTYCLPYDYEPGEFPVIQAALDGIIPDQDGQRAYMAHIGLTLLGYLKLHKALVIYGAKRSGKTTLLNLALLTCGHQKDAFAGERLFDQELEGMRSRHTWHDRRLVCIDELPLDALVQRNEGLAKTMMAHGGVPMRGMHMAEELDNTWRPKLIMTTNDTPQYIDRSGALTERLIIVECPNTRTDADQDHDLIDKMCVELPQFATVCIQEAKRAISEGQYPGSDAMRTLRNTMELHGNPLKAWVADDVEFDHDGWEPTAKLYAAFNAYLDENGYDPRRRMSQPQFTTAMKDGWPQYLSSAPRRMPHEGGPAKQARGLKGLRLITSGDPDPVTPVTGCDASDNASVTGI